MVNRVSDMRRNLRGDPQGWLKSGMVWVSTGYATPRHEIARWPRVKYLGPRPATGPSCGPTCVPIRSSVAEMDAMRQDGLVDPATVARAIKEMGVDPDKLHSASV